jgi:Icc protein
VIEEKSRPVTVMVPGDLHLTDAGLPNHQIAKWVVDQANNLIKPDFVQFIGDNVQDATLNQFALFRQLTECLQCEWFALVGDHDVHADPNADGFRATVGETWGSFRLGGYRFIRLNTQEAKPVGMSDEQLAWFRNELADGQRLNDRIVIFQHNYAYQIWEDFAGPGIDDWRVLTQSARIEALFCGHTHYWQVANDGRNVHIATRSIGDPEGGDAGYLLICLHGSNLGVVYRTPQDQGPVIVILQPRAAILCTGSSQVTHGEAQVTTQIWSERRVAEVTASIDDGLPLRLRDQTQGRWGIAFDAEVLAKGIHHLTVRATDRSGDSSEQSISFVVDQTGRYTAVPCVSPTVLTTNFC